MTFTWNRTTRETLLVFVLLSLVVAGVIWWIWQSESQLKSLNQRIISLNKENALIKSEDARKQLADYTDAVGKYEAIKDKVASYKSQGVDVSSEEPQLPKAIDLILGHKYTEANGLLSSLDTDLEKGLQAKEAAEIAGQAPKVITKTTTSSTTASGCGIPAAGGYCYLQLKTANGSFYTHIVAVNASNIYTLTDNSSDCADNCPAKPLANYLSDVGASAGIHGTYFCPPDYASCAGKVNSYYYPVYNTLLGKWLEQDKLPLSNRAMYAFTSSGPIFYPQTNAYAGVSGLRGAVGNEPGLVNNHQNIVGNYSLTSAQLTKATRGGIGVKGGTAYFVISLSASVPDLAAVMMAIGVDSALNLDGGGSAALIYQGKYKVGPGRQLPNAIVAR